MKDLERRLRQLEENRFVANDGVEAIFITLVDSSKEGKGRDLPAYGWRFQRFGADDVVTMRRQGEDDESLQERHMNTVRPLLARGSVPLFMPIISQEPNQ